ncbi:hypothetical protein O3G_MSEX013659 [Manduca sexta]|uniref:Uncharacterized protein n=1 Tax=Manduca sexta TaxID=7130 RepID=A0A922CYT5_MANSE|nr:hypothetical protein O3G_MSEX013659 [Manduca sexta]
MSARCRGCPRWWATLQSPGSCVSRAGSSTPRRQRKSGSSAKCFQIKKRRCRTRWRWRRASPRRVRWQYRPRSSASCTRRAGPATTDSNTSGY